MNRRNFCKTATVAGVGFWAAPNFSIGQPGQSANAKVNIGWIGVGGIGQYGLRRSLGENIVALCDVDWRANPGGYEKRAALKHAQMAPKAERFIDFRKMFDKMGDEIDAVAISTPDHTHFSIAMEAMRRGKHVMVQKPLAHNIHQVRTLQAAAKKYQVKTVMGNQGHCFEGAHRIVEWYRKGILGDVEEVHCWTDRPRMPWFTFEPLPVETAPVPEGVDWDLWQGPVAECEYSEDYMPLRWRAYWKYGCGALGDIGCHTLDVPFWALDLGYPDTVEIAEMDRWENSDYTPRGAHVIYHFPAKGDRKAVKVHWYEGKYRPELLEGMTELPPNGMYMKGSKETVYHEDMRAQSPRLWPSERMLEYRDIIKEKTIPRSHSGDPHTDLWAAIRGEIDECGSNFEYAAPLTEMVLLGSMAIRANETITWNPETMECSSALAQQWVKEPVREGWEYTL
ncbi:MAG: Gfo/Idh/MocA family oxidoreductase [Lentimonas sp.]